MNPQTNAIIEKQKEIKILPVKNGFLVTLPQPKSPFGEIMGEYGKELGKMIGQMEGDALIAQLQAKAESDTLDEPDYALNPDQYQFIFHEMEHVLAFLSKIYIPKR